ncbi:hypothetical protein RHSP_51373 [Rhizobium freirei PRF 81]|uniref:Uncharacterized protein n=1 Tax=Rhizobium freirei PRF 81 TaxID=363754 RepID=N6U611_9HYPH|nr:hypothetical protein RHSP_51373 [Rhizobium freirei PRF 81]
MCGSFGLFLHSAGTGDGLWRHLAEDDHAQHFVLGDVFGAGVADDLAVLHDRDAVGEVEDVVDVVADEEDADAFLLQLLDQLADLRRFLRAERRRRLVHDKDAGVEEDGAGDCHRLALATGERLYRLLEALEVGVEAPHHFPGLGFHRDIVERAPAGLQLAAEIEVGGGVDIVGDGERLVDRLDAVFLGVARRADIGGFAINQDVAAVTLVGAGEDLDQGRFAGAVMAEKGDDFAGVEVHRGVVDRVNAAEGDGNVLHFHKRSVFIRHGSEFLLLGARAVDDVEPDRDDQDDADNDVLDRRVDIGEAHARLQRLHDQGAEHGAGDRAAAAGKRRAADDGRCDGEEFVGGALRIGSGIQAGSGDGRGNGCEQPHQREDAHRHPAGLDAGEFSRLRVAADGEDITAETQARGDEGHDDTDADGNQHGHGDAVGDVETVFRPGNIVLRRVFLRDAHGPVVDVEDIDRAEHQGRAEDGEEIFGPERPARKVEALALVAFADDAEHDHHAGKHAEDPAPGGADRAFCAAAHDAEGRVERRDRLTAGDIPGKAAPGEKAAKGDDEGGHIAECDDDALERAEQRADEETADQGDDPGPGTVEAEIGGQIFRLNDAHDHGDEAEQRADRKVDIAGDDDEHHAGSEHRDLAGLDRKVPEISGRQEQAAGIKMKADPDDQQCADHAKQAGIDFGGAQEARQCAFLCVARTARCCGMCHVGHRFAVLPLLGAGPRLHFVDRRAVSALVTIDAIARPPGLFRFHDRHPAGRSDTR